jgi:hypothetical protein
MERSDLLELHKRNGDRPQFYREHRDEFAEHLSDTTAQKLPDPDASTFEWRQFVERHKGTITRQLNDSADGTDPTDDAETTEVEA